MACIDLQTECLRVVTIAYLKNFIGSFVQNSANGSPMYISSAYRDDYCPTYSELIGGSVIQTWAQGATPQSDIDGIVVNATWAGGSSGYSANQLVDQRDLSLKYTRFNSLSVSRNSSEVISECGGSTGLGYVYNYKRYTKSMDNSCSISTSESTDSSVCGEITYYSSSFGSVSNCTTFSVGKNGSWSAPARTTTVSSSIPFRGTTYASSNSVSITQNALTGSYSVPVASRTQTTSVSAWATTSTSFGCDGGSYGASATKYYDEYTTYKWMDSCGTVYDSPTEERKTGSSSASLGSQSGSFSACESEDSRSATLTFSDGGYSDSVTFNQDCSGCGPEPPTPGECIINGSGSIDSCGGGTKQYTIQKG